MIKPLTSLRFVFAFMVFLLHIANSSIKVDFHLQWLSDNVFKEGYIGVGFFFMLSGFILAYNYKDKLLHKKINKKNFWIRRLARIYPIHILTLYLSFPLVYILWNYNLSGTEIPFLLNFLLIQTYILPDGNWFWSFNTVSWSISDEMFFYFLFPFIIYFLNRFNSIFIGFVILASVAIPFMMFNTSSIDFRPERFYIQPFFRIVDFLIGILLYEIYLKIKDNKILRFANNIELFAILLFALFFAFHNSVPQVFRFSCYYWIPMALIILIFSFQKGEISQLLSEKQFVYLGEISYSFYMFHALIIEYFIQLNRNYFIFKNYYFFIFFLLGFSIFLSSISYSFIEKPLNHFIIKKFCR